MELIHEAPTRDSFIPLSTHQSQTPDSFFSGPPVLYYLSLAATLRTQANELSSFPALQPLFEHGGAPVNGTGATNGDPPVEEEDREVEAQGVDVWVSSECDCLIMANWIGVIVEIVADGSSFSPFPSRLASRSLTRPSRYMPSNALTHPRSSFSFSPNLLPSMTMTLTLLHF